MMVMTMMMLTMVSNIAWYYPNLLYSFYFFLNIYIDRDKGADKIGTVEEKGKKRKRLSDSEPRNGNFSYIKARVSHLHIFSE